MGSERVEERASTRDEAVDFLRGVLILLMIFGHVPPLGNQAQGISAVVAWIYSFHMPIFLIISGYFFFPRVMSGKEMLQPLFRRLVVPYLLFEALYLMALYAVQFTGVHTSNEPPSTALGFVTAELVRPIGAFWFIHALIVSQLSFIAGSFAASRLQQSRQAALLTIFGFALAIMGLAVATGVLKEWAAIYLVLGVVMRGLGAGMSLPARLALPLGVAVVLVFAGRVPDLSFLQIVWNLAIMGAVMALARSRPMADTILAKALTILGKNTLSILIFHAFFVVAMRPSARLFLMVDKSGVVYSLVTTGVAAIGCLFIARMIDTSGLTPALFGQKRLYAAA